MANQRIDIDIKVNSKTGEISLKSLDKGFDNIKIKAGQAEQAARTLNLEVSKISSGGQVKVAGDNYQKLGQQMGGAAAASGSATSSVLELGRVISDSNYGIRGMANNLSQLASNVLFSAKAAGGFGLALGQIGKAMLGPLGILLAIQTGIALLERFSMSSNEAEKAVKGLGMQITSYTSELEILKRSMDNENVTQSQRIELVNDANEKYEDLNVSLDENGRLTDESVEAIDRKIAALTRLARANFIQSKVEEVHAESLESEYELNQLLTEANFDNIEEFQDYLQKSQNITGSRADVHRQSMEMQIEQFGEYSSFRGRQIAAIIKAQRELDKVTADSDKALQVLIKSAAKGDQAIRDIIDPNKNKGRGRSRRASKRFKAQILDLQKFILNNLRKEAMMLEENEVEKLKIKQKYEREDLVRRRTEFRDKQQKRLDDFLASSKSRRRNAEAKEKFRLSQIQADGEYFEALSALGIKHTAEKHVQMLELERKFAEELVNQRLSQINASESMLQSLTAGTEAGSLNNPMSAVGAESIDRQNEMARQRMDAEQANFEDDLERKKKNLLDEGFELLQVEQMVQGERHAFQMNQVQQEIELERNKIEAKKNINQEYISWLGGLGGILKNIAGENEALANAALVLEKGAAIANIVVETQAANAGILVNTGKEAASASAAAAASIVRGSLMVSGGNPAGLGLIKAGNAGIAQAAAIKSGGAARVAKNKIAAGISIASILSTGLGSQGSVGGPSGGGGEQGGGGRSFDFNLVGSTGINQLAEGIGGQFEQPIQAYVVSSQMTSQQQLDNVIQSSATIGD